MLKKEKYAGKILNQKLEEIKPLDVESMRQAEERWKTVAKPLHSLGKLEEAVIRMAGIREDADFIMKKKGSGDLLCG